MTPLDVIDRKIMYELDLNARATASEIGARIRKPKETVQFRIKRLLARGYLDGFYTIVNTSRIGRFYYKTFLKVHRTRPETEREFIRYIQQQKNCAYLASCEGKYDLIFLLLVQQA